MSVICLGILAAVIKDQIIRNEGAKLVEEVVDVVRRGALQSENSTVGEIRLAS
jgi:hypothetical protein